MVSLDKNNARYRWITIYRYDKQRWSRSNQDRNQKFIWGGGVFLPSLLSLSFPFLLFVPRREVAPQIQLRDLGSAVSSP